MIDRRLPVGDALDLDLRLQPHDIPGLGQVDEGALRAQLRRNAPLQHHLTFGRHVQVHRLAANQGRGGEGVGEGHLVDALRRAHRRRKKHVNRHAEADGNFEIPACVHGLAPGRVGAPAFDNPRRKGPVADLHKAMEAGIGPVLGVPDDGHARGDVRSAVGSQVGENGKGIQIG